MLARLLRKTIGALNTSSETVMESNNMRERRPESGLEEPRAGAGVFPRRAERGPQSRKHQVDPELLEGDGLGSDGWRTWGLGDRGCQRPGATLSHSIFSRICTMCAASLGSLVAMGWRGPLRREEDTGPWSPDRPALPQPACRSP